MKLYLLEQNENLGYDTYDAVVVCAMNADDAKVIYPSDYYKYNSATGKWHWWNDTTKEFGGIENYGTWASTPDNVQVTYLGRAMHNIPLGVVLASFNAG